MSHHALNNLFPDESAAWNEIAGRFLAPKRTACARAEKPS